MLKQNPQSSFLRLYLLIKSIIQLYHLHNYTIYTHLLLTIKIIFLISLHHLLTSVQVYHLLFNLTN